MNQRRLMFVLLLEHKSQHLQLCKHVPTLCFLRVAADVDYSPHTPPCFLSSILEISQNHSFAVTDMRKAWVQLQQG